MSGVSTHYALRYSDGVAFDKRIPALLEASGRSYLNSLSMTETSRVKLRARQEALPVGPWRKRLLLLWPWWKDTRAACKGSKDFRLTEYKVRRGRGIRHMDAFKTLAAGNRAFKVPKKAKNNIQFVTYAPLPAATVPMTPPPRRNDWLGPNGEDAVMPEPPRRPVAVAGAGGMRMVFNTPTGGGNWAREEAAPAADELVLTGRGGTRGEWFTEAAPPQQPAAVTPRDNIRRLEAETLMQFDRRRTLILRQREVFDGFVTRARNERDRR